MTTLNFVEGEGISIQTSPNPGDTDVLDIEIAATAAESFDPATATVWWFPLADADGTLVLDADGNLIPTLIPLEAT